jgi:choline dehydrogenase-like flavoprotein
MTETDEFDVCVIGTGAGGGVMIQELTAAGFKVVALERGGRLSPAEFMSDDELSVVVRDELFSPDQLETWRPDTITPTETGRFNFLANCVGGAMTHWAGWSWRYRPDDFKVLSTEGPLAGANLADWPVDYGEMEPYYERAEWEFGVSGDATANPFGAPRKRGYPNPPHPDRLASEFVNSGAKAMGLHPFPTPMGINSRPYGGRPKCIYGGACQMYGCPVGAKASTLSVSLPKALASGRLDLRPHARVVEISLGKDGRARNVRYLDNNAREQEVRARHIVVSCGAIGTPYLLQMSASASFPEGLANSSGQVGRNLTFHVYSYINFTVDQPAYGYTGVESLVALDDWHASDPKRGFIRGGVVADINMLNKQPIMYATYGVLGHPTAARGWGAEFKAYLRDLPRTQGIIAILEDLPLESNRIDLDPQVNDAQGLPAVRITHRQHANDEASVAWYNKRLLELADACGAKKKWKLGVFGDKGAPMKGSGHIHGTCRMGNDPERSVVDRWCRSHDVKNLWVVDGSVFPTPGGYNPTLTILANAYRVADHFVREAKRGNL